MRCTDQHDICRGNICDVPLNLHDETLQMSNLRARPLKRSRQSQSQRPPNMVDVMTRNHMRTGYRQLHVITISHKRPDMPQRPLRLIHRALDIPWHQDRKSSRRPASGLLMGIMMSPGNLLPRPVRSHPKLLITRRKTTVLWYGRAKLTRIQLDALEKRSNTSRASNSRTFPA